MMGQTGLGFVRGVVQYNMYVYILQCFYLGYVSAPGLSV